MIGYGIDILLFLVIVYQFYQITTLQQSVGALLAYIKQRDNVTEAEIIEEVLEQEITEEIKEYFTHD